MFEKRSNVNDDRLFGLVSLRLTKDEHEAIKRAASKAGESMNNWLREAVSEKIAAASKRKSKR